ncbi:hypothetical protein EOA27_23830 [Mesorhizobium sp. M2A.F.Ca.ET.037.01.1.1]|uniref:hypothetical protein n=1 Tax=unclassified Mesorhizobium TaxID=325217 RepID=UPI000FC9D6E3|nr:MULTISPECIES: hypothetical protein [unclassified Mesorhizobium]RUX90759.1 hypothetical protein EOA25_32990 [Mesorhizobium sp. M2A.F.Ca.ET.040.01.1.1]RUX09923.1 hypothetical protein EOA27_23830 [Mesorhizobium sp. M2A.F.Ca.ET.037.01.1.1]RWA93633.1 MAG: hypothetical protein EOQ31_00605 [Mesorhizobium sp.]TIV18850.1 MAG: hypothetical protein E5V95_11685 [Mesorhizobium sp.]TIV47649.1 MAG: hypothetical protein E5V96_02530 [Mesorhizobium sp.]
MRRGRRPLPGRLHLVTATYRADRHGIAASSGHLPAYEPLPKPKWMHGKAALAWQRYIEPSCWLDQFREAAAIAFCLLWAEFQLSPRQFGAAKHSQMRAYMADLGLLGNRRGAPE